ncbi:pilus assembly protein TadE [Paenarthrobacter nitroguajacolicus]|uniref:TadE family type IV pilus minor pilin n=1 Tax=Paenarthrobacter nitroguajacolicus TaxID=211146 RepID=UPI0015BFC3DE|nr:TadE family type IV pilus minor pilin [Paenarthrobacter nitroguajacolicus]NWL12080.1 pilus assembly protein TadE [Paenarthrobacter nitroguajacolicus]
MTDVLPARGRVFRGETERGAVTAEFAVALPAVVLLLAFLLAGGAAGITQLRLEEAVRAGARASARGETTGSMEGIVKRLAGDGVSATLTDDGEWLTVTASSPVGGALGPLVPWTLKASASARAEAGTP